MADEGFGCGPVRNLAHRGISPTRLQLVQGALQRAADASALPIFEANHVDIVFAGHVHNCQRSFPLTFPPASLPEGSPAGPRGPVAGEWKLDQTFSDGATAQPHGVIYIVSGAGGADLYNPEQQNDPTSWQAFTNKFISQVHSLSVVDVEAKTLRLKQVSDTGEVVDSFRITK